MRLLLAVVTCAACSSGPAFDPETNPTFAVDHPRVYITANKARLQKSIADQTPAAMRFVSKTDTWVGGGDVYGFSPWNAALLGQLTGDAKYCKAATAAIEKQVNDAASAINGGNAPEVAGDDYLQI